MPDQSAPVATPAVRSHFDEVAQLSHDLKKLLNGLDSARLKDEVKVEIEHLDQWTDTYLAGLEAAQKINELAGGALSEARKELDLAYQQYLVLEDEGGNVATPRQQRHTEDLSKALRRINNLIPAVAAIADPTQPQPDIQPPLQEPGVPPEVSPPVEDPSSPPDVQPDIPPVTNPTSQVLSGAVS